MENKITLWQRYSAMLKMVLIAFLTLLLLIPSFMIQSIIHERKYNQQSVVDEVGAKWGKEQVVSGPILSIPYLLVRKNEGNLTDYVHYLPETMNVKGEMDVKTKNRNIYKVIGYSSDVVVTGKLTRPDLEKFGNKIQNGMDLSGCIVQVPVSDLKGIKEKVFLETGNKLFEMNPGPPDSDISSSGLWIKINLDEFFDGKQTIDYKIHFKKLDGTQRIKILPLGKETVVNLRANWESPSFDGNFLPEWSKIDTSGFNARWTVLSLNRNFPQEFKGYNSGILESEFGVSFIQPVDHYLLSERSSKYAILIIALTFLSFFFCEITANRKIHPIQYILIGLALVLFFTLLLSLSEQIGFDKAYFVSAFAIISLIAFYVQSILKRARITFILTGIMTLLYGFIYIILQLENYALLFGSIGLFVILALVMFVSRKIDWYNVGVSNPDEYN
ncbi:MAG: cell envelope integrity protein CreD [Flavobacteriales bacterium]|nr:cell envelope integrity protein CreD [Flavobacteriales bacterium]